MLFVNSLAEELLAKESIGLPDIIRILGDRPFPMKETVKEYLQELIDRKEKENAASDSASAATTESAKEEDQEKPSEDKKNAEETPNTQ